MPELAMTPEQRKDYDRFEAALSERGLPEPVRVFLLALRAHQLQAQLPHAALARRAAALETALEGELPAGRARVGHDKNGCFSRQRLSDELAARGRLPRAVLVRAVAEAYAHSSREPGAEVLARLEALRLAAEHSAATHQAHAQDQALESERRFPTYTQLKDARDERDQACRALERSQDELAELQQRYRDLTEVDLARAQDVDELEHRTGKLLAEVGVLQVQLAQRDRALEVSRARSAELEGRSIRLRGEADQLAAEVEELREQLAQVRGDATADRAEPFSRWDKILLVDAASAAEQARELTGPLVPHAPKVADEDVIGLINDIQRGRFDPTSTAKSYPRLPRRVVLHVSRAADALGMLPRGCGNPVIPMRVLYYDELGPEDLVRELTFRFLGLPLMLLAVPVVPFLVILGMLSEYHPSVAHWAGALLSVSPARWLLPVAVLIVGFVVLFRQRDRASLPVGWLLMTLILGVITWGLAGAQWSPNLSDLFAAAFVFAAGTMFWLPIAIYRDEERAVRTAKRDQGWFARQLTRYGSRDRDPSAALVHRLQHPQRFEVFFHSGPYRFAVDPQIRPLGVRAVFDGCSECHSSLPASTLPTMLTRRARSADPQSLLPLAACTEVQGSVMTAWLYGEGDLVREGDPLGVVSSGSDALLAPCPRCKKNSHPRMKWTTAPVTGVIAQQSTGRILISPVPAAMAAV